MGVLERYKKVKEGRERTEKIRHLFGPQIFVPGKWKVRSKNSPEGAVSIPKRQSVVSSQEGAYGDFVRAHELLHLGYSPSEKSEVSKKYGCSELSLNIMEDVRVNQIGVSLKVPSMLVPYREMSQKKQILKYLKMLAEFGSLREVLGHLTVAYERRLWPDRRVLAKRRAPIVKLLCSHQAMFKKMIADGDKEKAEEIADKCALSIQTLVNYAKEGAERCTACTKDLDLELSAMGESFDAVGLTHMECSFRVINELNCAELALAFDRCFPETLEADMTEEMLKKKKEEKTTAALPYGLRKVGGIIQSLTEDEKGILEALAGSERFKVEKERRRAAEKEKVAFEHKAFSKGYIESAMPHFGRQGWAPMTTSREMMRPLDRPRAKTKRTGSALVGVRPKKLYRLKTDGLAFSNSKMKAKPAAFLIDCSASMDWDAKALSDLIRSVPKSTVALYAGSNKDVGSLKIVAEGGKCCSAEDLERCIRNMGEQNQVDLPALKWLSKQPGLRYWVSDGVVTWLKAPEGESESPGAICQKFIIRHQISRVLPAELRNVAKAIQAMKKGRIL